MKRTGLAAMADYPGGRYATRVRHHPEAVYAAYRKLLAPALVATFASLGIIELAVDDTVCRQRGLTIDGTGMHHDPLLSSRALQWVSWGHDWVVVCPVGQPIRSLGPAPSWPAK
jgi:hypothetical protein